jgi:phospholipase/lecithinase/hemolysin
MNFPVKPCRLALVLVATLGAGASTASATTFQYSGYTVANEQYISISSPNNVAGGAGQITLYGSGPNLGQSILAYCLDIFDYLKSSSTYQVGSLTAAGSGGSNPTLTPAQINEIGALIGNGNALIGTNSDVSAAVQLAIWEVEYGAGFTFTGLDAGAKSLAAIYLANVAPGGSWAGSSYNISLLSDTGNQDLVFVTPLPGALPLFASGLGAIGLLARRWKRKTAFSA